MVEVLDEFEEPRTGGSINGENFHYGTPQNPCASDRIPGGSSSGSAVAVGAKLSDFSLGTDTGGSVRVPASYCGILGFRPSHGAVSTSGVIPMAQSFDTVGWFARDPVELKKVGGLLLPQPEVEHQKPTQVLIAEDCFKLSSIPSELLMQAFVNSIKKLFGGHLIKQVRLGNCVEEKVPSLKHFMIEGNAGHEHSIPSLAALARSMQSLQRFSKRSGQLLFEGSAFANYIQYRALMKRPALSNVDKVHCFPILKKHRILGHV